MDSFRSWQDPLAEALSVRFADHLFEDAAQFDEIREARRLLEVGGCAISRRLVFVPLAIG